MELTSVFGMKKVQFLKKTVSSYHNQSAKLEPGKYHKELILMNSAIAVAIGLSIAIFLIYKKCLPVYALILGA